MRSGRVVPVLALAVAVSCGAEESAPSTWPTVTTSPVTTSPVTTSPVTTSPVTMSPVTTSPVTTSPVTTSPVVTSPVTTSPVTTSPVVEGAAFPASWLRYGADGLVLASAEGDQVIFDEPIGWATSDGAGGVLFTEWDPHRFGPTWWLPGGAGEPVIVSEWDDPLVAARLDGRPVAVGPLPGSECDSDGGVDMVAHVLTTGDTYTLACGVGMQDRTREPDSFGGGRYVGVEWDAVHASGRSTAIRLVFRDQHGTVVELPTNPFADDCSPCELTTALSPDGTRLAVVHRPDAIPYRPDEYEEWSVATASVAAELTVYDLSDGAALFSRVLTSGAYPQRGSWFDGRFAVIGPDRRAYPWLAEGDRGDAVRALQQRLVDRGADIEVDGIFGPGTGAAVEAFHVDRFGQARSAVGPDTWAELGATSTIIDTSTGTSTELWGRIALEVIFTDPSPS